LDVALKSYFNSVQNTSSKDCVLHHISSVLVGTDMNVSLGEILESLNFLYNFQKCWVMVICRKIWWSPLVKANVADYEIRIIKAHIAFPLLCLNLSKLCYSIGVKHISTDKTISLLLRGTVNWYVCIYISPPHWLSKFKCTSIFDRLNHWLLLKQI